MSLLELISLIVGSMCVGMCIPVVAGAIMMKIAEVEEKERKEKDNGRTD